MPDLVIEVLSPGTAFRDRSTKFKLYERYGAKEYWMVDPDAEFLEVWYLKDNAFVQQGVFGPDVTFQSAVLSGKTVALKPLFTG